MNDKAELKGVGGWLLWFIIGLILITPIYSLGGIDTEFDLLISKTPSLAKDITFNSYKRWIYVIYTMEYLFGAIAGFRLWKTHTLASVEFARIMLCCLPVFSLSVIAVCKYYYGSSDNVGLWTSFAKTIIYSFIWYSYLDRSVRVRNTYEPVYEQQEPEPENT